MTQRADSILLCKYYNRCFVVDLGSSQGPAAFRTGLYLHTDGTWKRAGDAKGTALDSFESHEDAILTLAASQPDATMLAAMSDELRKEVEEMQSQLGGAKA